MANIAKAYVQIVPTANGIQSAIENALGEAGEKSGSKLGSALAKGLKASSQVIAAAGAAAVTGTVAATGAVAALAKEAVSGYADYEQFIGGVETLFGDSATKVIEDAGKAFKDAGMSANQYMETSIQSAAALINSLEGDQAQAASLMNMSITDMADNVNKMGTSMESVQDAYRGFSRGNFTMLDNLALGFAGTKEGMQELLDKAQELSGVEYDISSYADIVQAIHEVQNYMGITGTTQKEAAGTIAGSIASLQAAWENLVVGMADENSNMDGLILNVVNGAETVFNNLMPVIEQSIGGITELIAKLIPVIAEKLPGIIGETLPTLLEAGAQLLEAIGQGILENLPVIIDMAVQIITELITGLVQALPQLVEGGLQIIIGLANGITEMLPELIPTIVEVIIEIVNILCENIDLLIDAAGQLMLGLAEGLVQALPILLEHLPELLAKIIIALLEGVEQLNEVGVQLIGGLLEGIIGAIPSLIEGFDNLIGTVVDWIKETLGIHSPSTVFMNFGEFIVQGLIDGITSLFPGVDEAIRDIADNIIAKFTELPGKALSWGKDLLSKFIEGIMENIAKLKDKVGEVAGIISDFLHFSEPDVGPLSNFHTFAPDMMEMFSQGILDNVGMVEGAMQTLTENVSQSFASTMSPAAYDSRNLAQSISRSGAYRGNLAENGAIWLTIPVYIGQKRIETFVIDAINSSNYKNGGR